jgi:hypothetical protein
LAFGYELPFLFIFLKNMTKKIACFFGLLLGLLLTSSWGFLVHRTSHQLATYALPASLRDFFHANMASLVQHSVRPDMRRSTDKTEATKHFIDADAPALGSLRRIPRDWSKAVAKFTEDTLRKYGTVPWEILRTQQKLTEAFRRGKPDSVLYFAADLGHYIADAHVPLHTTLNYDGQLTEQNGLHALWESTVPELNIETYNLLQRKKARYIRNLPKQIFKTLRTSHQMLDEVFEMEKQASVGFTDEQKFRIQVRRGVKVKRFTTEFARAYGAKLGGTVNKRLLETSQMIADCWYTAWVDAGKPDLSQWSTQSESSKARLQEEVEAWQKNQLLAKGLLLSRKNRSEEFE